MVADVVQISESQTQIKKMQSIFKEQTQAFRRNPMPSYEERVANLKKLRQALLDNEATFIEKNLSRLFKPLRERNTPR